MEFENLLWYGKHEASSSSTEQTPKYITHDFTETPHA